MAMKNSALLIRVCLLSCFLCFVFILFFCLLSIYIAGRYSLRGTKALQLHSVMKPSDFSAVAKFQHCSSKNYTVFSFLLWPLHDSQYIQKTWLALHRLLCFLWLSHLALRQFAIFSISFLNDNCWYGMVWYGMVWYGMVWYGMVWYGMVWYGMVWYGMVWYGMVWYGMVWYGIVWYGTVWYGMV